MAAVTLESLSRDVSGAAQLLSGAAVAGCLGAAVRLPAWRLFLGVVPPEPHRWASTIAAQRVRYASMRKLALASLDEAMAASPDDGDDAAEEDSHQLFVEESAFQIHADLCRCTPDGAGAFFLDAGRQAIMFNVLLTWSAHHDADPRGYRQGMHELLAPLLWVLEESVEAGALVCLPPHNALNALRGDLDCLEADVYWLFDALMKEMAPLYAAESSEGSATAVQLCEHVQYVRLQAVDQELYDHLHKDHSTPKIAILPQVYMLAWLRLAFGRQLTIQDTVSLWDAFFAAALGAAGAARPALSAWLCAVSTVLLVAHRERLLRADSTTCITLLLGLRAPPPRFVVHRARKLLRGDDALEPLIQSSRQHAALADIFGGWVADAMETLGVGAAAPRAAAEADAPRGAADPSFFAGLLSAAHVLQDTQAPAAARQAGAAAAS